MLDPGVLQFLAVEEDRTEAPPRDSVEPRICVKYFAVRHYLVAQAAVDVKISKKQNCTIVISPGAVKVLPSPNRRIVGLPRALMKDRGVNWIWGSCDDHPSFALFRPELRRYALQVGAYIDQCTGSTVLLKYIEAETFSQRNCDNPEIGEYVGDA
jgi:hypothetical protein